MSVCATDIRSADIDFALFHFDFVVSELVGVSLGHNWRAAHLGLVGHALIGGALKESIVIRLGRKRVDFGLFFEALVASGAAGVFAADLLLAFVIFFFFGIILYFKNNFCT